MPKLNELDDITIEKAEKVRQSLGISQRFISECLGLHESVYSSWKTKDKKIPDAHKGQLIDIFHALRLLKNGHQVDTKVSGDTRLEVMADILDSLDSIKIIVESNNNKIQITAVKAIIGGIKKAMKDL